MRLMFADRGTGEPVKAGSVLHAGKKVPPEILSFLMDDHATVLGWFDWYESADNARIRTTVTREILLALAAHMRIEEELLYPAAARVLADEALVDKAVQDHAGAKA